MDYSPYMILKITLKKKEKNRIINYMEKNKSLKRKILIRLNVSGKAPGYFFII
jgi:uncharacterized protein YpiB (UPF0302 family)